MGTNMSERVIAAFLSAAAISLFLCEAQAGAHTVKAHKTVAHTHTAKNVRIASSVHRRGSRSGRVAGLIPPPPAYMPCVLPELYYHGTASGVSEYGAAEKKENPYKAYVSTPNGDAPEAMSSRKGVVTWNNRR
jgi:hypothetical protein